MPLSPPPRILLVDDQALFRTGLGLILGEHWVGSVLLEASTLAEALALRPQTRLDLILLDVSLPDADGLELIDVLKAHFVGVPVLMVSGGDDPTQITQARERGAVGYLSKSASVERTIATLRECLSGGTVFPALTYAPALVPTTLRVAEARGRPTDQQRAILQLLGKGAPNKVIASQVGLSENDVRAEVSWLTEMLDASSRGQAYEVAVRRGWVTP